VALAASTHLAFNAPAVDRRPYSPSRDAAVRGVADTAISAIILTKNSAARIADVLHALAWCDEVVVLDTGSTDATLSIAATFANVSLHQLTASFPGFGKARQQAVRLARYDWILAVDSDEIVSRELAEEITTRTLDPGVVYVIPFANYYAGRHITTCGWSPDCHERLFHRGRTNFCGSEVHERIQTRGLRTERLRGLMHHYSYAGTSDFVRKMGHYAQLFATQNRGRKRSSATKAVARSAWAFFKSYIVERGFTQGVEGLTISAYKSQTVFWKYMMLREANARIAG
jgi:glycosyltransferase involved in cell wall biosynthesis